MRIGLTALALSLSACGPGRLPLRAVTLSGNGLGYFERSGELSGDTLRLRLRSHEIDDVLKTIVVLSDNGEKVGAVASLRTDKDISTLELKLSSRKTRTLRVAYAVPTPAWTPIYRVVLGEPGAGRLQGWVLVQNPTEEDWQGRIVLATGAPFSIAVDLHTPRFIARPDATGKLTSPTLTQAISAEGARATNDRDGDGILDAEDKCPNEPETFNGFDDEDGCPDKGRVIVRMGRLEILDKIYFGTNSAEIKEISEPIIDATAATLKGNPKIEVIDVVGHAATNEAEPVALSLRRATAIVSALTSRGIERARLHVVTRGADVQGTGEASWSRQRNVEFRIARRVEDHDDAGEAASKVLAHSVSQSNVKIESGAGIVRYTLDPSIVVPHRASSVVAIWNEPVNAEEIYLYRPQSAVPGSDTSPMRAVHLVGLPATTLEPGPIAIYVRGAFVGDALLNRLHAGETTVVPFALDGASTVRHDDETKSEPVRLVSVSHSFAHAEERSVRRTRYEITASVDPPSKIFVAHRRSDRLTPRDLPPGAEMTPHVVLVPAALHASEKLTVVVEEESPLENRRIDLRNDAARLLPFLAHTDVPTPLRHTLELLAKQETAYDALEAQAQKAADRFSAAAERRSQADEDLKALGHAHATPAQRAVAMKRLGEAVKASNAASTQAAALTTKAEAEHDAIEKIVAGLRFGVDSNDDD